MHVRCKDVHKIRDVIVFAITDSAMMFMVLEQIGNFLAPKRNNRGIQKLQNVQHEIARLGFPKNLNAIMKSQNTFIVSIYISAYITEERSSERSSKRSFFWKFQACNFKLSVLQFLNAPILITLLLLEYPKPTLLKIFHWS